LVIAAAVVVEKLERRRAVGARNEVRRRPRMCSICFVENNCERVEVEEEE
jgi:hypothetical protein